MPTASTPARFQFVSPHTKSIRSLGATRLLGVAFLFGVALASFVGSVACSAADPVSDSTTPDPLGSEQGAGGNDGAPDPSSTGQVPGGGSGNGPAGEGGNGPGPGVSPGTGAMPNDVSPTPTGVGPGNPSPTPSNTNEPGPGPAPTGPPPPLEIMACEENEPVVVGRTPLRRISMAEFNNAVRDLFNDDTNPAREGTFPADELLGSFVSNSQSLPTVTNNEQLLTAVEIVSGNIVGNLSSATGCASVGDSACIDEFLSTTAQRAFRGAWEPAVDSSIQALYQSAQAELSAEDAFETAIQGILLDPRFLYVVEFGSPQGEVARLAPREIAGRLASFLWLSVPSMELLAAADSGSLDNAEAVQSMAETMLDDPRATQMTNNFAEQWLILSRFGSASPEGNFTTGIQAAMLDETLGTVTSALRQGTFSDLLTSPSSPSGELAAYYGAGERPGVLAQGSVMVANAGPVKRGRLVRQQIMCDTIPDPPNGVEDLRDDSTAETTVEVFRQHAAEAACWACHQLMDPIGIGFAYYDDLGRYSETENGVQLTTAGEFIPWNYSTLEGPFSGLGEMTSMLASDEKTQQCFTTQMMRFALGRVEQEDDRCSLGEVYAHFSENQLNIRELLLAIAGSDAFLNRDVVNAGGACQ